MVHVIIKFWSDNCTWLAAIAYLRQILNDLPELVKTRVVIMICYSRQWRLFCKGNSFHCNTFSLMSVLITNKVMRSSAYSSLRASHESCLNIAELRHQWDALYQVGLITRWCFISDAYCLWCFISDVYCSWCFISAAYNSLVLYKWRLFLLVLYKWFLLFKVLYQRCLMLVVLYKCCL